MSKECYYNELAVVGQKRSSPAYELVLVIWTYAWRLRFLRGTWGGRRVI